MMILALGGCKICDSNKSQQHRTRQDVYPGHFKIGQKYTIKNQSYKPINISEAKKYSKTGLASWYGGKDHGKLTANGDKFDKNMLTAAHKSLPLPCIVRVTNLENDTSIILMVNDRGPFVDKRIIDVSAKAADILQFKHNGVAKVRVDYLHNETEKLLAALSLKPQHGARGKAHIKNPKKFIEKHMKGVNSGQEALAS